MNLVVNSHLFSRETGFVYAFNSTGSHKSIPLSETTTDPTVRPNESTMPDEGAIQKLLSQATRTGREQGDILPSLMARQCVNMYEKMDMVNKVLSFSAPEVHLTLSHDHILERPPNLPPNPWPRIRNRPFRSVQSFSSLSEHPINSMYPLLPSQFHNFKPRMLTTPKSTA